MTIAFGPRGVSNVHDCVTDFDCFKVILRYQKQLLLNLYRYVMINCFGGKGGKQGDFRDKIMRLIPPKISMNADRCKGRWLSNLSI